MSRHWEYAYLDPVAPSFTADVSGSYTLQLGGTLAFTDRAYPASSNSTSQLSLTATP